MLPISLLVTGLRSGLSDVRDATELIPISQSDAGWLLQLLALGENSSDILTDDEIDVFILYPIVAVAVLLAAGGVGLVVAASFYINFTFFKH